MTTPRHWTDAELIAYVARAEVRAIALQDRRHPIELDPAELGTAPDTHLLAFEVETKHETGEVYTVVAYVDEAHPGAPVVARCSCPSGTYRGDALAVPCWHAALVGRRLEQAGLARRAAHGWVVAGDDRCPACGAGTPAGAFDYAHDEACPDYVSDPFDLQ